MRTLLAHAHARPAATPAHPVHERSSAPLPSTVLHSRAHASCHPNILPRRFFDSELLEAMLARPALFPPAVPRDMRAKKQTVWSPGSRLWLLGVSPVCFGAGGRHTLDSIVSISWTIGGHLLTAPPGSPFVPDRRPVDIIPPRLCSLAEYLRRRAAYPSGITPDGFGSPHISLSFSSPSRPPP